MTGKGDKMRAKYVNVSIHEDLAKKIDKYIAGSKLGFTSRAGVVNQALREFLQKKK
ncbi:MAG: ribbon-helix-helix domain-containing protein [Nanoarchaeota archaeon]|nr:ribbon-helix-helix domain-containing protein [Nanoarchaeota archaeon]